MFEDAENRFEELAVRNDAATANNRIIKMKKDLRITGIGSWLHKVSIDELPHFINVIKDKLGVVRPRPSLPCEVADYERERLGRLRVLPGIAGLRQVSGRGNLSFDEMVDLDRFYAGNWSPGPDLQIMLKTIRVLFKGEGAY